MGGGFTGSANAMNMCDGQDVLKELDAVFLDTDSDRYDYAKQNNTFDMVEDVEDNYRALISAYVEAGVDVCARWGAYLRKLGRSEQGQKDIHRIAQTRYKALTHNVPVETTVHPVSDAPNGGKHVKNHHGSGSHDKSKIHSPFPLPD
jgi:hypothetical protein